MEDERANGDDARGELCPANLSCTFNTRGGGPTCAACRVNLRHFRVVLERTGKLVRRYVDGEGPDGDTPLRNALAL